jgi:integrase
MPARQQFKIHTRTGRAALPELSEERSEPYWRNIARGLALGYYKGARGGTWIGRHFSVETGRRKTTLGLADDVSEPDGVRVLSFDQAQAAAHAWYQRLRQEDTGEVIPGRYTVADAMADYIKDKQTEKRRTTDQKRDDRSQTISDAFIIPTLGRIELVKLTHGKVKAWRDSLANAAPRKRTKEGAEQAYRTFDANDPDALRKRQASANRILTVLKAALNHAHTERRVASKAAWEAVKPFRNVDVPKVRFLSAKELKSFVPKCESDFRHLVQGALLTGARYGELTALHVEHFDAKHGTIFVAKSKNGEARHVHLNDEGVALFTRLIDGRAASEYVFVKANGNAWRKSEQKRPMDEACNAAKVKGVTFHVLRHSYASHALMNRMPLDVLQKQLGHKDLRITMRHYAHLCSEYKQEQVRAHAPTFGFAAMPRPTIVSIAR